MAMDLQQRMYFRDMFRDARAAALADAEGFQEILFAVERLGSFLLRKQGDLGKYEGRILEFLEENEACVTEGLTNGLQSDTRTLYRLVREARNSALHQGAFARQLTTHAIQLAIAIESALTCRMSHIGDYAIHHPVCAAAWHPVSFVRQTMLASSFSCLPISTGDGSSRHWKLIVDVAVAAYLRKPGPSSMRARLRRTVGEVISSNEIELVDPFSCVPDTDIHEALANCRGLPILVVTPACELIGIATPFDLL